MSNIKFLKKRFLKKGYLLLEPLIAGMIAIGWLTMIGYMFKNSCELFDRAHTIFVITCKTSEIIEKKRAGIEVQIVQSAYSISADRATCHPLSNGDQGAFELPEVSVSALRVAITWEKNEVQQTMIMWGHVHEKD